MILLPVGQGHSELCYTFFDNISTDFPKTYSEQSSQTSRERHAPLGLLFSKHHTQRPKLVHLSFLPVGHTHEDIDAKFSKIADLLRRNEAETLPALLHLVPNAVQTQGLYDVRQWLEPCINNVSKHSKPLHFKFSKILDNIKFQYKSSSRKSWTLSENPILDNLPSNAPKILFPPHFGKIIIRSLRDNILKHKYHMTDSQFWWWQRFIDGVYNLQTNHTNLEHYAANEAMWILPKLKACIKMESSPVQDRVKQHLTEMLDKELDDHQVLVSSKKRKQKKTPNVHRTKPKEQ